MDRLKERARGYFAGSNSSQDPSQSPLHPYREHSGSESNLSGGANYRFGRIARRPRPRPQIPEPRFKVDQEVYTRHDLQHERFDPYWIARVRWDPQEKWMRYELKDRQGSEGREVGWFFEYSLKDKAEAEQW